jgi:hypothetical protein
MTIKMKNYALILLTFFFASCEYEAQLSYKVKNNSTATIKVISTNTDSKTSTDTFLISPNDQTTIAVNGQGLSRVSNYKEKNENLRSFSKMDIFQNDTTKSITDFLKTARWIYNENDKHSADYILTVLQTDF